jgi:membrane fusion protein, copper/silver efflux system
MRRRFIFVLFLILVVGGSFLAGSWYTQRTTTGNAASAGRKILYYVDPMHPAYKSDKPGIAPDCGMELVPVYEDGNTGGAGAGASGPPGTVTISAEKQQLIGVKMATVSKAPVGHRLRVLGRVAAGEDHTYKLIAASEGWLQETGAPTTGSLVKKGEVLASLHNVDFLTAQQNYLLALFGHERIMKDPPGVQPGAYTGFERSRSTLRNLGMSDQQIEELSRHRRPTAEITLVAPATGIVLARNLSPGQRVEKGLELFRIADLTRIWILADVLEDEGQHLRPGTVATASVPQVRKTFPARVSHVLPVFDGNTRTLKVRLEADNPGLVLRPDMFADLELPISHAAGIFVPADAVVDSGLKKTVYVDKGDGVFEPRRVEIGWRAGDQVEIVKGLMPGERIVVAGTFLIDSESRMKAAAAGIYGETAEDPACGIVVDIGKAQATGRTATYQGETYYFSSDDCKAKFAKEPTRYTGKAAKSANTDAGKRLEGVQWEGAKTTEPATAHTGHAQPPAPPTDHTGHR